MNKKTLLTALTILTITIGALAALIMKSGSFLTEIRIQAISLVLMLFPFSKTVRCITDQPYPGKAPVKVDRNGFFKEPEIKYNIILDEKKCVLTYAFSPILSGGIFYEILGEEGNYSVRMRLEKDN